MAKKKQKTSPRKKTHKIRKDCTVKTLREKYGLELTNSSGRKVRSDKKVATIRKEHKMDQPKPKKTAKKTKRK